MALASPDFTSLVAMATDELVLPFLDEEIGVYAADRQTGDVMFGQLFLKGFERADQNKLQVALFRGAYGPGDYFLRSKVAAHGVNSYAYSWLRLSHKPSPLLPL
jgi:hypothetical protein